MKFLPTIFAAVAVIHCTTGCSLDDEPNPTGLNVDASVITDSGTGWFDSGRNLDADTGAAPWRVVMPSGVCRQTLARGAVNDEFFPRLEGEVFPRKTFFEDIFDPATDEDFNRWRRKRYTHNPIGAMFVEDQDGDGTLRPTSTYARRDASHPFVFQQFIRTAPGFGPYISQFSLLINGDALQGKYRIMSLDGDVLSEHTGTGAQQVTTEPYAAYEVEFEPDQLPAGEVVDLQALRWILPYDDSKTKTWGGGWTGRYTFYNGGNAWPDKTISFLCPNDDPGWPNAYEEVFGEEHYAFFYKNLVYLPDHAPEEHEDIIEVDSDTVEIWHLSKRTKRERNNNYSFYLYVNGEAVGEPVHFHDPDWWGLGWDDGNVVMRRPLTVELDPERDVNVVHVSGFLNILDPFFTAQGIWRQAEGTYLGQSNVLYLRRSETAE